MAGRAVYAPHSQLASYVRSYNTNSCFIVDGVSLQRRRPCGRDYHATGAYGSKLYAGPGHVSIIEHTFRAAPAIEHPWTGRGQSLPICLGPFIALLKCTGDKAGSV